jgi:hypothetical protein
MKAVASRLALLHLKIHVALEVGEMTGRNSGRINP